MVGPEPISFAERSARIRRIRQIAKQFGFSGRIEYRHVVSSSGGAQVGIGQRPTDDILIVYAEAFVRDADPEDFSLEAIIAHERGHQIVCRSSRLQELLGGKIGLNIEEVLASLAGSLVADEESDQKRLIVKATFDATENGIDLQDAVHFIRELRRVLELII